MPDQPGADPFGIDLFPVGCLATDRNRVIRFANAHAAAQLERSRDALVGSRLDVLLTPASRIFCDSYVYPILLEDGHCDEIALTVRTGTGADAPVIMNVCVHADDPELTLWSVMRADKRDKLQQEALNARNLLQKQTRSLRELASRDQLTGLLNRRAAMQAIAKLIAAADRASATVAVVLLDIDRFKAVNDTYGHEAGDEVLRQIGAAFTAMVRTHEIAGRYGGEEFVFAIAAADAEAARPFSRRLHEAAARVTGSGAPVTVSVGVCCRPPRSDQPIEAILNAADKALYQAKLDGRNRTMIATDGALTALD